MYILLRFCLGKAFRRTKTHLQKLRHRVTTPHERGYLKVSYIVP